MAYVNWPIMSKMDAQDRVKGNIKLAANLGYLESPERILAPGGEI